jgi:hypothetical protein
VPTSAPGPVGTGSEPNVEAAAGGSSTGVDRRTLVDLRRARRHRRTTNFDPFEALYRAYLTGIVTTIAVWLLSGVVGDTRVSAAMATRVTDHGAPVVGMAIGVIFAIGLRSGGRGGPLVIEAADVRHVLLSPVDRALALRAPAIRQLRFGAAIGTAVGAVAGLLAYRRLPGEVVAWLVCGAATGALSMLGGYGLALLASGRRIGSVWGSLIALGVAGWSLADLLTRSVTSPATFLGQVALWPLDFRPAGLIGAAVPIVAVVGGLAVVGGTSIEAAERRATLVGQIRFAATLRDLRTVVVLRRQLAQELPRQRPWLRLPRALPLPVIAGAAAPRGRVRHRWFPVWRRGWHGILRFPALRFARLAVAGGVAGAALVGAWRGTTPLILVAGLALYVAGLDVVEPIAQELDHPDRTDSYAVEQGILLLRASGPPIVLMILVALVGLAVAVVVTGGDQTTVQVGAVLVVPASLCAVAGASMSVIQGPPPTFSSTDNVLPPEMAGIRAAVRTLLPPLVVLVGVLPMLAGRHVAAGQSPAAAVTGLVPPVVAVAVLVGAWVRYRARAVAWWRNAMADAKAQGAGARRSAGE